MSTARMAKVGVHRDHVEQFRAAMHSAGLNPPRVIEPGKLHRFRGKRGADAWCRLAPDLSIGVFGCRRAGLSETWRSDAPRECAEAEVRPALRKFVLDGGAKSKRSRGDRAVLSQLHRKEHQK